MTTTIATLEPLAREMIEEEWRRLHREMGWRSSGCVLTEPPLHLVPALLRRERAWGAVNLGRILVLVDTHRNRSLVQRFAASIDSAFPARTSEIKRWLERPSRNLGGVWFLADISGVHPGRRIPRRQGLTSVKSSATRQVPRSRIDRAWCGMRSARS